MNRNGYNGCIAEMNAEEDDLSTDCWCHHSFGKITVESRCVDLEEEEHTSEEEEEEECFGGCVRSDRCCSVKISLNNTKSGWKGGLIWRAFELRRTLATLA